MNWIEIGNGEVKVAPIAFESFGVRGMATLIRTDDVSVLVDPGSALGPRYNLMPHRREYVALAGSREEILEAARQADVITISHYHYDHYVPDFEDWTWVWSSKRIAERVYRGKIVLAKDIESGINLSQRKRGAQFLRFASSIVREIESADGKRFEFGRAVLRFSDPVFHGPGGSQLGSVIMLSLKFGDTAIVHASDVQGPIDEKPMSFILEEKPEMLIIGGPPLYLKGYRIDEADLESARSNMERIARHVPLTVFDHHLLRSLDYQDFMKSAEDEALRHGHRVVTAAGLLGKKPLLLEARRRELYATEPMEGPEDLERLRRDF
ncbi:MAG: hypothetical protein QXG10_00475 [Candidatus Hadarchaeales archaeon]